MSKIVILCEDYGNIATALYLVTNNPGATSITLVVPGFDNLYKFFQVINEKVFRNKINLPYIEPYVPGRVKPKGVNKIFHVIPDIFRERQCLRDTYEKYFAGLEECEVFFFSRGFGGFKFYLLEKLSKRNKLVFVSSAPLHYFRQYTPTKVPDLAGLAIAKLIYGFDIAMGKIPFGGAFLYLPDSFIRKKVSRVIDWEERNRMKESLDLEQFKIFDTGNYSVIYFDDALIGTNYIPDRHTFQRELDDVFHVLAKYFPDNEIAIKYHPSSSTDTPLIKAGRELAAFIPAELVHNDSTKLYLTVASYAIVNVEKGLAVSLVDLFTLKDEGFRSDIKGLMKRDSKSRILFPKSLDEFERILLGLKSRPKERIV